MKRFQRIISGWLAVCLMLSALPVGVLASEADAVEELVPETTVTESWKSAVAETTIPGQPESAEETVREMTETPAEETINTLTAVSDEMKDMASAAIAATATASGTCGENLTWTLDSTGKLTISGTGRMTDYVNEVSYDPWFSFSYSYRPWEDYLEEIKTVEIKLGTVNVGSGAFYHCTNLTEITLPGGLATVGAYAFYGCSSLTEIDIPSGVQLVGSGAFLSCSALTRVTLPEQITEIREHTFESCVNLSSITIPQWVFSIEEYAFSYCGLSSISLPDALSSLGKGAFYRCSNLRYIKIPEKITVLPEEVFYGSGVESVDLPAGLTGIEANAFAWSDLTLARLPAGLETLDVTAFNGCGQLTAFMVPEGNSSYCAVDGVLFTEDMQTLVQYPAAKEGRAYTVPNGVKTLGESAFLNSYYLNGVLLPEGLTTLEKYSLCCDGLQYVVWPESLTEIDAETFRSDPYDIYYGGAQTQWEALKPEDFLDGRNWNPVALHFDGIKDSGSYANHYGGVGRSYWTMENGVLTLSGLDSLGLDYYSDYFEENADFYFSSAADTPWGSFRDDITKVVIDTDIRTIPDAAFMGCSNLEQVVLTDCVMIIGENAFAYCPKLKEVTASIELYGVLSNAFYDCYSLDTVIYEGSMDRWNNMHVEEGNECLKLAAVVSRGVYDYFDNTAITINGSGSAIAYYTTMPDADIAYEVNGTIGYARSNENGLFSAALGTFSERGEHTVTVNFTHIGGEKLTNPISRIARVTVTPLTFTQDWQLSMGAEVEFTTGGPSAGGKIGPVEADASLGKAGASVGGNRSLTISGTQEGNRFDLEITTDQGVEAGVNVKSGITGKLDKPAFNVASVSAGVTGNVTGTYGIAIDDFNWSKDDKKALGTFFLGECLNVTPNMVLLKPFYAAVASYVYEDCGASVISGSGVGVAASAGADLGTVKVCEEPLFTFASAGLDVSVSMSEKHTDTFSTKLKEREAAYKLSGNLSTLISSELDVGRGLLGLDILGRDVTVTAKTSREDKSIQAEYLSAKEVGLSSLIMGERYSSQYSRYIFEHQALDMLLKKTTNFDGYLNGNRRILTVNDLGELAQMVGESEIPLVYNRENKEQMLLSVPFEIGACLGLGLDVGVELAYLEKLSYMTAVGYAQNDQILLTSESDDLQAEVEAKMLTPIDLIERTLSELAEDVTNFFTEAWDTITNGVKTGWGWIKEKTGSLKKWVVSLTYPDGGKGKAAFAQSYSVEVYSQHSAQTSIGSGIEGAASGNIALDKAATVGRPILVSVEDSETGEVVTDLSEEPLEFTIRYAPEDLEAAGVSIYSPVLAEDGLAMYRYSDEGDYFEYIGGTHDRNAMTVTATIVKTGQYVLAVDACPPQLASLDISDFRQNPTITAQVDDLTGMDMDSFVFRLDGKVKVDGTSIGNHYNVKTGEFTYTVPEGEALAEGQHTMAFTLTDTSGNSETYEFFFTVDLTAPVLYNVSVTGTTNAGSLLRIRAKVTDETETNVYTVFSKELADGSWTQEVSHPMTNLGDGTWGLDYEGDGSTVKVYVTALDLGGNSTSSEPKTMCAVIENVVISQDYLALYVSQNTPLTVQVQPESLNAKVRWTVESDGENVISVDETGLVTALSSGTAYAVASVEDAMGNTLSARCRVDVAEAIELKGVTLSTSKLTTELYSTEYTEFDIALLLPQNLPAQAASAMTASQEAAMAGPTTSAVAIEDIYFNGLSAGFELVPKDDRTVRIVPTQYILENPEVLRASYTDTITVTVQGVEYVTDPVTLTIKKTLPKLKATIAPFNSFYSGQSQQIQIPGATVTDITCDDLPEWLRMFEDKLILTEQAPQKNTSAKLTLMVKTKEWAIPIMIALSVKNTYKTPGLKLSASSVSLAANAGSSAGVSLTLLPKNKKDTLSALDVTGITTPEGFRVEDFSTEDGSFTLRTEPGFPTGKINLYVHFGDTDNTLSIPLTVKSVDVKLKAGVSAVTLNSRTGDGVVIGIMATPADYLPAVPSLRLVDSAGIDKLNSGELRISYETGRLFVGTTDTTPDNEKYTLYVSAEGGKEAALKISTTNAEPTLKLKAAGNLDISFPDRKIGLTTTFKNHSGGNLKAIDYTVTKSIGKTILDEDSKAIQLTKEGADLFVQLKDTANINIKNTYTLNLKLTLADDSVLESSVKIPVKQTAVNLKLSANKLTLNKAIDDKATVTVTCATKDYNFTAPVWTLLDSKGNDASGQLDISWNNGKLTVATTKATPYGGSYKLMIAPEKGAKAVALAIVIPAEAKSTVTGTLKATGNLDVIRDGTALTVTPTWKNCNDAERTETLTIRNGSGEDVTAQFVITEENGKYILTRGAHLDHTQKYTATLTATFANGTTATASGALKLKMGSAKLTLKADSTTLFANDKHSRVNVSFASADSTLNKVAKVTLDPKLANQFELFDYGNGQYAIGFKDGAVPAKLTSVNLAMNVWLEGNETAKANASVKVKLSIIR